MKNCWPIIINIIKNEYNWDNILSDINHVNYFNDLLVTVNMRKMYPYPFLSYLRSKLNF